MRPDGNLDVLMKAWVWFSERYRYHWITLLFLVRGKRVLAHRGRPRQGGASAPPGKPPYLASVRFSACRSLPPVYVDSPAGGAWTANCTGRAGAGGTQETRKLVRRQWVEFAGSVFLPSAGINFSCALSGLPSCIAIGSPSASNVFRNSGSW